MSLPFCSHTQKTLRKEQYISKNGFCIICLEAFRLCRVINHPPGPSSCEKDDTKSLDSLTNPYSIEANLDEVKKTKPDEFKKTTMKQEITGLCDLIGYSNDNNNHGVNSVISNMKNLWRKRGLTNKEDFPLMCCVAAPGQGKTELCRQLCLQETVDLEDVDEIISIHVSFGQFTTYNEDNEKNTTVFHKFLWRVLYALTNNLKWLYCSKKIPIENFHSLVSFIKENSSNINKNRITVLFAVDEIMKLPSDDVKNLLDSLATLQHLHLKNKIPTFVLVTSLSHHLVLHHITNVSTRPIQKILLPSIADDSFIRISDIIANDLINEITAEKGEESENYRKRIIKEGEIYRFFRIAVSMSGMRFRDLELILKSLYTKLVSQQAHANAISSRSSKLSLSGEYDPGVSCERIDPNNDKFYFSLKKAFLAPAFYCDTTHSPDFDKAMSIFSRLMIDPNFSISEDGTIKMLLSKGFIIVENRVTLISQYEFIPRINLASIHKYAMSTAESRSEFRCPSINSLAVKKNIPIEDYSYLSSTKPRVLKDHTTLMVNNILAEIYSSMKEIPVRFEDIMIWVELTRAYSYSHYFSHQLPSLDQVLPRATFMPWTNESLHVSSWIMTDKFLLSKEVELKNKQGNEEDSVAMINQSLGNQESAIITQSRKNSNTIDYVASHFTSYVEVKKTQVMLLCSMKLRENKGRCPVSLLAEIHQLAKSSGLTETSYYAVLYCSWPKDEIEKLDLPKGSIVVEKETLFEVLHLFGASCLFDIVD